MLLRKSLSPWAASVLSHACLVCVALSQWCQLGSYARNHVHCDLCLQDYVQTAGKQLGMDLRVTSFARVQVGEGLEKVEKAFAAEVADTINSMA